MKRLLIITGPTASGKTKLGVRLAQMFNGELISADSRQVYKLMDIGTGKDLPLPVPIWGLDLVKPDQEFSVADWFKVAQKKIFELWKKDKLPIIVGGTGFYLKALINGFDSLGVEPDYKLRRRLEKMSLGELQEKLSQVYSQRYEEMNQSDKNNPRRLIRAIEVVQTLKKKSGFKSIKADKLLLIGLKAQKKYLYQKIDQRVEKRIRAGSEKEVKGLLKKGYGWDLKEVIQRWQFDEHNYLRRQLTFLKKMKLIKWFSIQKGGFEKQIVKLVKSWYD